MEQIQKLEFGSGAWFEALRSELVDGLAGEDLTGIDFTMTEEYVDPPDHLRPADGSALGFHYRIRDGVLEFNRTPLPPEEADVSVVGAYVVLRELAVRTSEELETYDGPSLDVLTATGKLVVKGDRSRRPEVLVQLNVHDRLAVKTV